MKLRLWRSWFAGVVCGGGARLTKFASSRLALITSNLQLTLIEHRPPGVRPTGKRRAGCRIGDEPGGSPCSKYASQPVPEPQLIVSLNRDRAELTLPSPSPVLLTWSFTGMRGGMILGGWAHPEPGSDDVVAREADGARRCHFRLQAGPVPALEACPEAVSVTSVKASKLASQAVRDSRSARPHSALAAAPLDDDAQIHRD